MKLKSICFVLAGIIIVSSAYGQNIAVLRNNKQGCGEIKNYSSILDLSKAIFQGVKENDFLKFSSAFMDVGDYAGILRSSSTPEQQKANLLYRSIKKARSATECFNFIRKFSMKNGVNWNEARFEYINYRKLFSKSGIVGTDHIQVIFSCKGKMYRIEIDQCIKTKTGWKILEMTSWGGRWSKKIEAKRKAMFGNRCIWNVK